MPHLNFALSNVLSVPARIRTELLVMETLWAEGALALREIQERIREEDRPSFEIIRLTVYRLESNKAVRRSKRIGNSQIFEAAEPREVVYRRLIRSFEDLFPDETKRVLLNQDEFAQLESPLRQPRALTASRRA